MTKIECYTENCEYNLCSKCTAGMVNFDTNGVCLTHKKRSGGVLAQSFADVEAAEDYTVCDCDNEIKCEMTNCSHNESCCCMMEEIKVDDGMMKTLCTTRQRKKCK